MNSWLWMLGGGIAATMLSSRHRHSEAPAGDQAEREEAWRQREQALLQREQELGERLQAARQAEQRWREELERLAGLTREQALERLQAEVLAKESRRLEQVAQAEWDRLAAHKLATAMGRLAGHTASEHTVAVVALPSEEMKGRIIGKDGRNLRLFESLTGVDVLVDEAPQSVGLSCFDGLRREKARLAMEKLVSRGRIGPATIEEAVAQATEEAERLVLERGRQAAADARVAGLHVELVRALGQLAFRSSYRQNVLEHSVEVSLLCASLAAELRLDVEISRRAGLLHDIGKGLPEGGAHAVTGARLCQRWGESQPVCHAVEAHHYDVPQQTAEAALVTVADAISAARPGARRENVQNYLERLESLEKLALSRPGVRECHILQAGREVRVFVRPELVDDEQCETLARGLVAEIEAALPLSGPVKVTVVRNYEASGRTR